MGRSCASMKSRIVRPRRRASARRIAGGLEETDRQRRGCGGRRRLRVPRRAIGRQVFPRPLAQRASTSVLVESGSCEGLLARGNTTAMRYGASHALGRQGFGVGNCAQEQVVAGAVAAGLPFRRIVGAGGSSHTSMLDAPPSREVSRVMALFAPLRGWAVFFDGLVGAQGLIRPAVTAGLRPSRRARGRRPG